MLLSWFFGGMLCSMVCFPLCLFHDLPYPHPAQNELTLWNDYFGQEMEKVKANAAGSTEDKNAKPVTGTNSPKANSEQPRDAECQLPNHQLPPVLARDFYDDSGKIRTRSGKDLV